MSKRFSPFLLILTLAVSLLLLASCVRPTPGGSDATATPVTAVPDATTAPDTQPPAEEQPTNPETPIESPTTAPDSETPTDSQPPSTDPSAPTTDPSAPTTDPSAPTTDSSAPTATPVPTVTPVATTSGGSGVPPTTEIIHIVQPGENLYRIGLQYGYSWVVLAQYNGIADPNQVYVGQAIRIPPAGGTGGQPPATPIPPDANYTYYVVQPGDNLFRIGLQYNVSWTLIAEANGLVNPNYLVPGQVLKIPTGGGVTPPPTQCTYVVQPGDTLFSIAIRYGVAWQNVAAANNLPAPYIIYVGQTLIIPGCTG